MLNFNPNGKKVILSVDGGGMRGMIPIAMLAELEQMTGQPCHQLFDLVAGTSTGAIIAAGIGLGFSAQELLDQIYRRALPNAFRVQPQGIWRYLRYALTGLRNLYNLEPFLNALGPLAVGKKIRDLQKPIVLLTAKDVRASNTYYVVSKGPGLAQFADWPVSGAVGASGAAPVYFPPVLGNLVDGGVGVYGNPCLVASVEALEYIGGAEGFADNQVIHISLGTGYTPNTVADGAAGRFWLGRWVRYIINESLTEASLQQVLTTRAIYKNRLDFRRYNPLLTTESVRDQLGIALAGKPHPDDLELDSFGDEQVALMEAIGRAYAHKIDWTVSGYMPWIDAPGPDYGKGRDGGHPLPSILPVKWASSPYR